MRRTMTCFRALVAASAIVIAAGAHAQLGAPQRIGAAPVGSSHIVQVMYASERSLRGGSDPVEYLGVERAPLHFGICEVGIPPSHRIGNLEGPPFYRGWDPAAHVMLGVLELHDGFSSALTRVRAPAAPGQKRDIFVFLHGYGNTFMDSCRRTAQLWHDLDLPGVPISYSWSSAGSIAMYMKDLATVNEWSAKQFRKFVDLLIQDAQVTNARVNLVAHSMGSRPLMEALADIGRERQASGAAPAPLNEVVLFAPEIPSMRFQELLPLVRPMVRRISLYGSSSDNALKVARIKYSEAPRAGDLASSAGAVGVDVISAENVDYTMDGHSYYAANRSVIDDLREVLTGIPVGQRRELRPSRAGSTFEFKQ